MYLESVGPPGTPRAKLTCSRNILRAPNPSKRHATFNNVAKFLQRRLHHLALKRATRKRVARNVPPSQVAG